MKRSWGSIWFAIFIAAMLALVGALYVATDNRADTSAAAAADAPPLRVKNPDRPVLLVVGDSFTGGSDMNTGPEWPEVIGKAEGWTVVTDAVGGTGYLAGGDRAFSTRVVDTVDTYTPDLVVLAGGRNDVDKTPSFEDVGRAARKEIRALREGFPEAKFVMLSNFASGAPTGQDTRLAGELADVAQRAGVDYVDVTSFLSADGVGQDGVHPTDRGHDELAEKIDAALQKLGLVDAIAVPEYVNQAG